jgi:hypothetical protein
MQIILSLTLAIVLQTTEPQRTVALPFNNGQGIVIVSLDAAEKEHAQLLTIPESKRTEMQRLRFAALVVALGTLGSAEPFVCADHPPRCRVLESGGRRLPLQNPNPRR